MSYEDWDMDGERNCDDPCITNPDYTSDNPPGPCGCDPSPGDENDDDGDGVPNCLDLWPNDPTPFTCCDVAKEQFFSTVEPGTVNAHGFCCITEEGSRYFTACDYTGKELTYADCAFVHEKYHYDNHYSTDCESGGCTPQYFPPLCKAVVAPTTATDEQIAIWECEAYAQEAACEFSTIDSIYSLYLKDWCEQGGALPPNLSTLIGLMDQKRISGFSLLVSANGLYDCRYYVETEYESKVLGRKYIEYQTGAITENEFKTLLKTERPSRIHYE